MGRVTDILRGKLDVVPSVTPWATATRAVVQAGGGNAKAVSASLGGALHVPGSRSWEASIVASRCIQTIASNLASVDLVVLTGDEADDTHPVAQLWNVSQPGAPVSARITRETAFAMAEVRGEAFIYLDRGPTGTGEARGAWPIYDDVDVVIEGRADNPHAQTVKGYVVRRGNQRLGLLPSEVLWLRYPHPTKAWHAMAPWAAAVGAAELDSYARAWQLGEFRNGAKPGAVIYLGDLDERAYNAAVADFRTGVEGAHNAGKSLLVAGAVPAKVEKLTMTPEEMSYLASRRANQDDQMLAFGIRPDYFRGQSTYENQRAAKVGLWSDVLVPKLDVLGSEVDRQLLPDPRQQAAFDVSQVDALQDNQDAIYNRVRGIAYTDMVLIDEGRALLGFDPLPNGEGQATLTAFRARISLQNQLALAEGASPADQARHIALAERMVLRPSRPRLVARRGAVVTVATRKARKSKVVKRPSPSSFYSNHERVGERAVAALADKQLRVVLRNLSKLRTSQVSGWATHAATCGQVDLGTQGGVLGRADDLTTGQGLSPWSNLPAGNPCTCQRIAADDVFDAGYWQAQTQEALDAWLRGVWEGAGATMADGLGVSFDVFDQRVLTELERRKVILSEQVTQTTRRVLDSQLLGVIAEEGWSIDDATEAIRAVFGDLSGYRASTIARTEVVGGYNAASFIGAQATGLVAARVWLTAEDERVRPSHQRMNGQRVEGTARYSNGLLHPGDPEGDPAETINCRCVETYELA